MKKLLLALALALWGLPAGAADNIIINDALGNFQVVCAIDSAGVKTLCTTAAPVAGGGCTPGKLLSAASNNSTLVITGAKTLCSLVVMNTTATVYYLKLYNKATAPTCASDTVVQSVPIPASVSGAGVVVPTGPYGQTYSLGIGLCITAALADNDNTSAATGMTVSYSYK